MTGSEIRKAFLRYFEERSHRIVPSSSLVPEGDPSLMFANAGMVQFKRTFVGEESRDYVCAASVQKCMRVSGKHNDLENVGRTARHHTFFEMLGNFSFGDYFKREAIDFAWELLTDVFGIDGDRLVVSVYEEDDEAFELWRDRICLSEKRIFRLDEKENFWQMGDTGPCGPCSEIHLIVDEAAFRSGANPSQEGFLELWNLVFMQFEQAADGRRKPLPKPSIDTGMGLERLAALLQGVGSNYDTDLFQPLIREVAEISGRRYGADPDADVSLRVVADHARSCAFLLGDGVLPSNEGRGYVLRRVLRRAARHGVLLGVEEPFLYRVSGRVIEEMADAYPDLIERRPFIEESIRREEERFLRTLGRGLQILDDEVQRAKRERRGGLAGDVVFKLYDTYGFPVDLTQDILSGHGLGYDAEVFERCMLEQSERARAAWKGSGESAPAEVYGGIAARVRPEFLGYERLEASAPLVALIRGGSEVDDVVEGEEVEVVCKATPFYAESGGQVGDIGVIEGPDGRVEVTDTRKPVDGLPVHVGRVSLGRLRRGDVVTLRVDAPRRAATVRNHSATHLLHHVLRQELGPQVRQAGSLVGPDRLRFDFTSDEALGQERIRRIEDRVNDLILQNTRVRIEEKPYAEALQAGAVAIFEERYADRVRVVSLGPSTELCGGTHARATGDIGCFRIVSESAIGAGVRRIEARTGMAVIERMRGQEQLLHEIARQLRASPGELAERVERLLARQRELERELEQARADLRRGGSADPMAQVQEIGGLRVIAVEVADADPKELRGLIDELKARIRSGVVLLASRQADRATLALGVTADLTAELGAGRLIKEIAGILGGSGGGRPDFAQAGGPRVEAIPEALERLRELVAAARSGGA